MSSIEQHISNHIYSFFSSACVVQSSPRELLSISPKRTFCAASEAESPKKYFILFCLTHATVLRLPQPLTNQGPAPISLDSAASSILQSFKSIRQHTLRVPEVSSCLTTASATKTSVSELSCEASRSRRKGTRGEKHEGNEDQQSPTCQTHLSGSPCW